MYTYIVLEFLILLKNKKKKGRKGGGEKKERIKYTKSLKIFSLFKNIYILYNLVYKTRVLWEKKLDKDIFEYSFIDKIIL